ncbi:MAG: methionyl-tRNA formyltransferase [Rhodospirillales bacterium]|nr:methionyl-tRNA formyltransferase [Rhodospirillales bacterium]
MKITVLTSTQRRHLALIETLASVASHVYAIQECRSVCPGWVDGFILKSEAMQRYFANVEAAEDGVFGNLRFLPGNVSQLAVQRGDLNFLPMKHLGPALDADVFVVFGASYLKGPLAELLIEKRAVNIHMGTSPFYRGNSCNFWAIYDGRPEYVGATIHRLSKGLDSGPMLFHALPKAHPADPFALGMEAVRAALQGLAHHLGKNTLFGIEAVPQDRSKEMRYSRANEFTDAVASDYLSKLPTPEQIFTALKRREENIFLRPFIG